MDLREWVGSTVFVLQIVYDNGFFDVLLLIRWRLVFEYESVRPFIFGYVMCSPVLILHVLHFFFQGK